MALWLETDSNANKDISSAVSVGAYTATGDVFVLPQILADQVAGNGDYVYYVTLQVAGAGSAYVIGPKTTHAAASGETAIGAQGGMIFMRNADVLTVYIDGLAGDTATPDVAVRFAAIPLPSAAAGASGGLPVLDANLVSAANVTYWEGSALPTIPTAADNAAAVKALVTTIGSMTWDDVLGNLSNLYDYGFAGAKLSHYALENVFLALGMAAANLDTQLAAIDPLTAQETADAVSKLAPTAGAPAAGSIGKHLDDAATAAALAVVDANVDAIKLITDTLDVSAVTQVAASSAGHLTITAGLTFDEAVTGLTIPADWAAAIWTLKYSAEQADTAARIQLRAENPAALTDGLQRLNGAAPESPITAADGTLTVTQASGRIDIYLTDELTALLERASGLGWDVKFIDADGDSSGRRGTADVVLTETRAVA